VNILPHCIPACTEAALFKIPKSALESMSFADIGKQVVIQMDALPGFAHIVSLYDVLENHGVEILSQ
jgi:hypothetical protein